MATVGGHEGAHHVERAVGEIDHAHDAEDERQAGGQQEQHQPELEAVENLLDEKGHEYLTTEHTTDDRMEPSVVCLLSSD